MVDNLNDSGNIQGIDQVGGGGGTFVIYYDPKVFALSAAVSANWRAAGRSDLQRRQRLDCRHFVVDSRLVAASITPPGSGNVVSTGGGTLVYLNFLVLPRRWAYPISIWPRIRLPGPLSAR